MRGGRVRVAAHLARRFAGSLPRGGPAPGDVAWVATVLLPGERRLWEQMPDPDRRHSVEVARRVATEPGVPRPVVAAALLHDVGKVSSGLGTFGRVGATLVAGAAGRARAARGQGRVGRYLRHPELGAEALAAAGSDPLTVAWAREHHRPPGSWTVERRWADVLVAADDD